MADEINQRVTNATVLLTLENLQENMEKGFTRIAEGQKEEKEERKKLAEKMIRMAVTHAECSAIQGQRWEAHNRVHDGLRTKRDQNVVDVVLAAMVLIAGALGITIKS